MKYAIKNAVRRSTVLVALYALTYTPLNAQTSGALFRRIDFSTSSSISMPFKNMAQTALGINIGMRALFRDADVRIYETIPATSFEKAGNFAGFLKNASLPQYGASFSLHRFINFPLTVKAGTLSTSGTFSRLATPELSSLLSPFSKAISTKMGITTFLPSKSSSKKQFGVSLDVRFPAHWKKFSGSGGTFYYRADGMFAASTDFLVTFPHMVTAGVSLTGGRFFLENKSSAWFSESPFFKRSWFAAFSVQAFVSSPYITSINTVNTYTQPDIPVRATFRSENKLTLGMFTMLLSGFVADGTGVYTTENSQLHTLAQLRAAPQYTWRFASPRLSAFTLGAASLTQRKYNATKKGTYGTQKFSVGAQYSDRELTAHLSFTATGFEFSQSEGASAKNSEYTVSTQFAKSKGKLRPSVQASCLFSSSSTEQSAKASIATTKKNFTTSTSAGISFKQKNGSYNGGNASLSFSGAYTTQFIKYAFNISATGRY